MAIHYSELMSRVDKLEIQLAKHQQLILTLTANILDCEVCPCNDLCSINTMINKSCTCDCNNTKASCAEKLKNFLLNL